MNHPETHDQELAEHLRHVRESAGSVPESVDQAVLSVYRRHMREGERKQGAAGRTWSPSLLLSWGFAAAAVLAMGIVLIVRRQPDAPRRAAGSGVVQQVPHSPAAIAETSAVPASKNGKSSIRAPKANIVADRRVRPHGPENKPVEARVNELPGEFRGLMYCDPLSCGGAMNVIRVQLPPTAMARPIGWPQTGVVNADVLVGPDGFARGIRIVQ